MTFEQLKTVIRVQTTQGMEDVYQWCREGNVSVSFLASVSSLNLIQPILASVGWILHVDLAEPGWLTLIHSFILVDPRFLLPGLPNSSLAGWYGTRYESGVSLTWSESVSEGLLHGGRVENAHVQIWSCKNITSCHCSPLGNCMLVNFIELVVVFKTKYCSCCWEWGIEKQEMSVDFVMHWWFERLSDRLIGWSVDWLFDWLVEPLVDWPVGHWLNLSNWLVFLLSDDHGFSLLHWGAKEGHVAVVDMLLSRGARVNQTNMGDDTPLHLAASHGHREIVLKVGLVSAGSDDLISSRIFSLSDLCHLCSM